MLTPERVTRVLARALKAQRQADRDGARIFLYVTPRGNLHLRPERYGAPPAGFKRVATFHPQKGTQDAD